MRIDRLSVLSRSLEWWCMAAFGRWSDLFGWFRQRTRSKLPSRNQNLSMKDSNPMGLLLSWSRATFRGFLLCRIPRLREVRFWATAGLWCSSMFWATRALQCQWEQESRLRDGPIRFNWRGKHRNHIDPLGTEDCNYWSRNEECLVGAAHQTVPITSLPFVHTARRCFRWWCNTGDRMDGCLTCPEVHRYFFNRGSKSRNKVAVGEPAAGSFTEKMKTKTPEGKEKNNCSFSILLT